MKKNSMLNLIIVIILLIFSFLLLFVISFFVSEERDIFNMEYGERYWSLIHYGNNKTFLDKEQKIIYKCINGDNIYFGIENKKIIIRYNPDSKLDFYIDGYNIKYNYLDNYDGYKYFGFDSRDNFLENCKSDKGGNFLDGYKKYLIDLEKRKEKQIEKDLFDEVEGEKMIKIIEKDIELLDNNHLK